MVNVATVLIADTWGMHGDDFGAGWMILMMGLMVLFWAAVILGIVWLVRGGFEGRRERQGQGRIPTASELLARRFAEGAMSVDEYRERRELIAEGSADPKWRPTPRGAGEPTTGEGRKR
jgi:uncharacterized membrane protein